MPAQPLTAVALSPLARFSLACVVLLCAAPFLQPYHRYPLTTFYTEWLAFALGIGVMTILLDRRTWDRAEVPWAALAPFALAFLLVVHGVLGWAPYFGQALTAALYLIWAGALIVAARALVQACGADTVFTVVAAGLAAGAVLSAMTGVIQHFNLVTPINAFIARPTGPAIFGNLAQPNHFATYTTLGLLSMSYLYNRGRMPLAVAAVCAMPLLFVLGLSGSRSVWLYLYAACGIAAWFRARSSHAVEGRRLLLVCGTLIIVHYAMQLLVGAGWFKPADRATVTAIERLFSGAASISDRLILWQAAWTMALEDPLLGAGWGAFPWRYFEYLSNADNVGEFGLYHNAHNLPLHLLAETGLIGMVLVAAPLVLWMRHAADGAHTADRWWLFALLAVLGLHSLLEYPIWYAYFLGVAALLLGAASANAFVPKLARMGRMLAFAMVLIGAFNLVTLWLDYRDFERVFHARTKHLSSNAVSDIMSRLHRNPVLTPYIELFRALPLAVDEADLEQRLLLTERALSFAPLETLVYRQVLLLALAGRLPEAQTLLASAQRVYPAAPPEFYRDLWRLVRVYPERFRPLLEFASHRAAGRS